MDSRTRPPGERRWQASPMTGRPASQRIGMRLRRIRLTPTRVTLGIALGGTLLFLVYAIAVRDASQIPMLSAGLAVLGIVFSALSLAGAMSTYRSARDGESGRAFGHAILGGIAALLAAGAFALGAVLALVWRG